MNIKLLGKVFLFVLLFPLFVTGVEPPPFYADDTHIAIQGYDVTTFFIDSPPKKGNKDFQMWQDGAIWYFVNEKNLHEFEENPDKYIPQYRGYCAWALIDGGRLQPGLPEYWTIIDAKLYLFCSADTLERFLQYPLLNSLRADAAWYRLYPQPEE